MSVATWKCADCGGEGYHANSCPAWLRIWENPRDAEITALRAALDQERADNAKLRAFAQHMRSTRTPISRLRMNLTMRALELLDDENRPTALLSGRGEVNDG